MLLDNFKWQLILEDGTVINQSDNGEKETFKFNHENKNFEKIKTFILVPQDRNLNKITLNIPTGARLLYFRRTMANTGDLFPKFHITMLGWQSTVNKVNIKYIMYIFPDGTIEVSNEDEPEYANEFIVSLPHKDAHEIKGCTNCQPRLEKE